MMIKRIGAVMCAALVAAMFLVASGCNNEPRPTVSASGVKKATTKVVTGSDGLTIEQRNVVDRLAMDNKPGSIKHLYIISAYSGQVLIYSTVRGKVTSSGKRLTPTSVEGTYGENSGVFWTGMGVDIGDTRFRTNEVLQDDGTYGSSVEYLFWWDTKGVYHQQYIQGGMILHISDQPQVVKNIVINMEVTNVTPDGSGSAE